MSISFKCFSCNHSLLAPESKAGQQSACPYCKASVTVPQQVKAVPPPEPEAAPPYAVVPGPPPPLPAAPEPEEPPPVPIVPRKIEYVPPPRITLPVPPTVPPKKDRFAGLPKNGDKTILPHSFVLAYDAFDYFVAMYGHPGNGFEGTND